MRPRKFFKEEQSKEARKAARDRGHKMWKFTDTGYLGTGYFVGENLPFVIYGKNKDRMTVKKLKV
jgi:hypothetical protein